MKKVLILGKGRIGRAIYYYLKKLTPGLRTGFFSQPSQIKNCGLLIGALPGQQGERTWRLALRFKKDLIDISDLDPSDYLKFEKEIKKTGITAVPECGFSPGLTNLICGREAKESGIREIEILAGSLSEKDFSFPFLWCFEDLVLSQKLNPVLIKNKRKIKVAPFSGYKKENIWGIKAESYFSSGLSSLPKNIKIKDMRYRVLRPLGFFYFFKYLQNYGFLDKKNLGFVKKILQSKKQNNITLAQIKIKNKDKEIIWQIKSFSQKTEKLNSMQKIAGLVPAVLAQLLLENKIKQKSILFMEKIGQDKILFREIIKRIKQEGILIKKSQRVL